MKRTIDEYTDEMFGEGFSADRLQEAWFGAPAAEPEKPSTHSKEDLDRYEEHRKRFAARATQGLKL